jgi:hypothetical protein
MEAAQPPAAQPPANRISPGDVISETFSIYRENAGVVLGSSVVFFVIVGLISGLLQTGGVILSLLGAIIQLAAYGLYAGFVVKLVQDVRDGRRDETVGELLSSAAPAILSLIIFGLLFGAGVIIGLALLIVPGLFLLTIWSVGAPAIVAEGAGVFEAFGRSRELVRGEGWSVFGTLVLVFLIVLAIGIVLGVIATAISDGATVVASVISNVITAPIYAIAVTVMFFDLGGGGAAELPAAPVEAPPPDAPAAPPTPGT